MLLAAGHRPLVVTNDIFTRRTPSTSARTLAGVLAPERVVGVETGSCPHTAVRDDPSMNLDAVAELTGRFPDGDVVLVESGRRQPDADLQPRARRLLRLRHRRGAGRQDPAQARSRGHQLRPAGHQQDRPRALRPRRPGGDGPRRARRARRAPVRLHQLLHRRRARRGRPTASSEVIGDAVATPAAAT